MPGDDREMTRLYLSVAEIRCKLSAVYALYCAIEAGTCSICWTCYWRAVMCSLIRSLAFVRLDVRNQWHYGTSRLLLPTSRVMLLLLLLLLLMMMMTMLRH